MTIFEMLEKLEAEIASLQTRCQNVAGSLDHPPANGNGRTTPPRKPPAARKKNKAAKPPPKKKTQRESEVPLEEARFRQLELTVSESSPPDEQTARALGKRQALGKSLVQLRKMSAWRSGRSSPE